jgi:hypothetical protein
MSGHKNRAAISDAREKIWDQMAIASNMRVHKASVDESGTTTYRVAFDLKFDHETKVNISNAAGRDESRRVTSVIERWAKKGLALFFADDDDAAVSNARIRQHIVAGIYLTEKGKDHGEKY